VTRFGILSTARINRKVLAGAAASEHCEVVAVGSRDGQRAAAYAREHGIARAHGSYEALLADPGVDAVYISLPNGLHCEWAVKALEAGKHVLCEKPMGFDPAEVEAVFDTAERHGLRCMEAFMWRHNPQTVRLAQLIAEGRIGELRLVRAAFSFPLTDPANVRLRADLAGGALMDLGCYCLSATRFVAGEPIRAMARQVLSDSGVDIRTAATLELPDDVLGTFHCAMDLPDRSELLVLGSEGSIAVRDPWHCRSPRLRVETASGAEEIAIAPEDSYRLELENLHRAIRGEDAQLLGRDDAVAQARAIALVRASAAA
jgi:predicted dehydrogenase